MKIGFNPAIKNQNKYHAKHNVSEHTSISNNQLAFKEVNKKYYDMAEKMYKDWGNITTEWYDLFSFDVVLFKEISKQDAIDTIQAIKKFVSKGSLDVYNFECEYYKNL